MCSKHTDKIESILNSIDFQSIGSRLLSRKPSASVHQSFFQDFGICSGQNTYRNNLPLGIAKPRIKPGTKDNDLQDLLLKCSMVLDESGRKIFQFENERLNSFAGDIVTGNRIEAMRLAITDEANLCGVHEDKKNDSNYPTVPVFSKYIHLLGKRFRVSIIMYSRKSIGDYLNQKNCSYGPAVFFMIDFFSKIPPEHRTILPGTFPAAESLSTDGNGLSYTEMPCHMDPSFFLSPVIHFGIMIAFHFSLNFAELVSTFRAWTAMPYMSYYFCSAVSLLLQRKNLPT